jgi:hypothetical protein
MPDHGHALFKHIPENMLAVVIAIAAWKNNDADFHFSPPPECS